ncbi:MAG: hypothetical protein NTV54_00145, partial [Ignavibacteriales bacterium]|nr:hypothetical protein [Ignavibacteriales bacterium]
IKKVADELLVVGLYKLVELNMKKVLCKAYDKEIGRSEIMGYSIKNIKKTLKDHGVSLSAIKNYSSIDELRVLNNAIKHEGKATKQLAAFPNWQTGAELTKLDIVFDRIAPVVPEFIEYLAKDLIS